MILGVYWANKFPEGLYTYRYFRFSGAVGGHADKPADLTVMLQVAEPERLLQRLDDYIRNHPETYLYIMRHEQQLFVSFSTWNMYDFDFLFVQAVEQILDEHEAEVYNVSLPKGAVTIQLVSPVLHTYSFPKIKLLQYVYGEGGKNSESLQLRFDCHIAQAEKAKFIAALDALAAAADLAVFYYKEQVVGDAVNLMLFFTNGRQIKAPVSVDVLTFDKMIQELQAVYNFQQGHIPGADNYPQGPEVIVRAVDREFVFQERIK